MGWSASAQSPSRRPETKALGGIRRGSSSFGSLSPPRSLKPALMRGVRRSLKRSLRSIGFQCSNSPSKLTPTQARPGCAIAISSRVQIAPPPVTVEIAVRVLRPISADDIRQLTFQRTLERRQEIGLELGDRLVHTMCQRRVLQDEESSVLPREAANTAHRRTVSRRLTREPDEVTLVQRHASRNAAGVEPGVVPDVLVRVVLRDNLGFDREQEPRRGHFDVDPSVLSRRLRADDDRLLPRLIGNPERELRGHSLQQCGPQPVRTPGIEQPREEAAVQDFVVSDAQDLQNVEPRIGRSRRIVRVQ